MSDRLSRMRATVKHAAVWGVAWGALGSAVATVMRINDGIPLPNAIGDGIGMGIRIGVAGAVVGAAFSTFIALAYRGKRLREISALRFGIAGAVLAGIFIPAFLQLMALLSGHPMVAWNLLYFDIVIGVVFGGIVAGGSMKLAQRDATSAAHDAISAPDALDAGEQSALGAGDALGHPAGRRGTKATVDTRR